MHIRILGTGCPNCLVLENNTRSAIKVASIEATVEKITDIGEIMSYNIISLPGLVIDEKVVSSGKVLSVLEVLNFLKK